MVARTKAQVTIAEFEAFVRLPQNRDKVFELLNGEIVEVPSNAFVSVIAGLILYAIRHWLNTSGRGGHVTGEGGGFIIEGQVFAPDVAYVHELPTSKGYEETPPRLAVEVISDPHSNTEQTDLRRKLVYYLRAGVVVWVVDYVARQVEIHVPGEEVKLVGEVEVLPGGEALPGLELPVKDIFPTEYDKQG
jgi:Uma2 family endonuclease